MADKLYFGVPGNIRVIPYPESGMGFDSSADVVVTKLKGGGRSTFRDPTVFKTLKMSWRSGLAGLGPLIDMYNGLFGNGPFYVNDPTMDQANVLPPRWSNSWQLAHQSNGWCKPVINTVTIPTVPNAQTPLTGRSVKFTQATWGSPTTMGIVRNRLIRVPGKDYYFAVNATATGGAAVKVRGWDSTVSAWADITSFTTFTGVSTLILPSSNTTYTMLELDLYMPLSSTLEIFGMCLGTVPPTAGQFMPAGRGVGALQFTSAAQGSLVSTVIDRIGLTVDLTEVQQVESLTL